jgi:Holliday junction resolvase RusA-like endonuclease
MRIEIVVYGLAQPAGSKRVVPAGGRYVVVDANKKAKPWKEAVSQVAGKVMVGKAMFQGPVYLTVIITMPRPKGHFGTGKNAGKVRESAPRWHSSKPDLLKMLRGIEDALTGVVWRDDAQVASHRAAKEYGDSAWVYVMVEDLGQRGEISSGAP